MSPSDINSAFDSFQELIASVSHVFEARNKSAPSIVVTAPGRVNLIGEHVDYNDGFVLPMAIERNVAIAAALRGDPSLRSALCYSVNLDEAVTIPLQTRLEPRFQEWSTYLEGVITEYQERGISIPAFEAVIQSNIPFGAGLSSSAALEVAMATLLEALTNVHLEPRERALLCQQAEHRFAGVPCGIMDQFSSVYGQQDELMLLDCNSQEIQSVPFKTNDVTVLITNSNVNHKLADGEYAKRRAQCDAALEKLNHSTWRDVTMEDLESERTLLDRTEYRRAHHVITEIARTTQAAEAFRKCDWRRVGELMYASHASLRDEFEVSCDELDVLVDLAGGIGESGGVFGSRMTGGGFGGCTVTLVRTENVESVQSTLDSQYKARTGITPYSFVSRPARGAHVVRA